MFSIFKIQAIFAFVLLVCFGSTFASDSISTKNITSSAIGKVIWLKQCQKLSVFSGKGFSCGNLVVPFNYVHPKTKNTALPVEVHWHTASSKNYKGFLFINFGGPWIENTVMLREVIDEEKALKLWWLSSSTIADYDIVTFDPRGINHYDSQKRISCTLKNKEKLDQYNRLTNMINQMQIKGHLNTYYHLLTKRNELCNFASGQNPPIYTQSYTLNTIKDMDLLRKSLTKNTVKKKINYYGGSYGTRLGLTYLINYPNAVKLMILDGNAAPNNNLLEFIEDTAKDDNQVLKQAFVFCAQSKSSCPLYDPQHNLITAHEMYNAYANLLDSLNKGYIMSNQSNQSISAPMLNRLVFDSLAAPYGGYLSKIMSAVHQAIINHDMSQLVKLYDQDQGYNQGVYTYDYEDTETSAVLCRDYRQTHFFDNQINWDDYMSSIIAKYPLFGYVHATDLASYCVNWPNRNTRLTSKPLLPRYVKIKTSAKVLLVGNSYDPQTPFVWTEMVNQFLFKHHVQHSLVHWLGMGHTALFNVAPIGGCTNKHINGFLLSGELPEKNIVTCDGSVNPFQDNNSIRAGGNINLH
ncbi:alpha/beta hydrolase [Thiotrichales bacterium 19X7-9]|nr:alpha/beta hydrolase [Thiotrichales bacterium 19X7-9]